MGHTDQTRVALDAERQLELANAEFEEFVSTAAHNLRESLREVAAYRQLLAETQAGRLDAAGEEYLKHIGDGAARMQSILADVVDYWTTSAGGREPAGTNMEGVLSQALGVTAKQVAARGAIVTHDPLPVVMGDFDILTKVVAHLLRNAITYNDEPAPRVHVSSRQVDEGLAITVQDNGPGIDQAFHARIFEAFRRLHGKAYPGNGLGLAFCVRAIKGMGGRIWLESAPGTGSTFYFTLPAADGESATPAR